MKTKPPLLTHSFNMPSAATALASLLLMLVPLANRAFGEDRSYDGSGNNLAPVGIGETALAADISAGVRAATAYTFTPISLCPSCSTLPIGITANGLISGLYFDA